MTTDPADALPMSPAMQLALDASFGGVAQWRAEAMALMDTSQGRQGPPCMVLEARSGSLAHRWVAADGDSVLLLLPVRGEADDAPASTALDAVDWAAVHARYQEAVDVASEALGVTADQLGKALDPAMRLDVRRAGVFAQATDTIPGARWRDPAAVARWSGELPDERPVVAVCVHGHEVSRAVALRLRALGRQAFFLRGGIEAWRASGLPLVPTSPAAEA